MTDQVFVENQVSRAQIAALVMQRLGPEYETAAGQFADRFLGMMAARHAALKPILDAPELDKRKAHQELATAAGYTVALALGLLAAVAKARA
jgi:hypothetical protein